MTEWVEGDIEGVVLQPIARHTDPRGWLAEIFRSDTVEPANMPAMAYMSVTLPGVTRGPHAHEDQSDYFVFIFSGTFKLKLWDNRPDSPTYGRQKTLLAGEENPLLAIVPPGVVHGYTNVSDRDGLVLNFPNRLYAGEGRNDPVDEIRYEDEDASPFRMSD